MPTGDGVVNIFERCLMLDGPQVETVQILANYILILKYMPNKTKKLTITSNWKRSFRTIIIVSVVTFFLFLILLVIFLNYSTENKRKQAEMLREYFKENPAVRP